ncbi:MAG: GldG family protein [Lactobacillales bacterium]|jgi:hypothetical protein|nr:GldG family protein [Lactobacillales bacterium]
MKRVPWKTTIFALALAASFTVVVPQVKAESAADAPAIIQPEKPNGKKILFDNTHGQTAGAADWVIDGGFSDFANALGSEGYYVTELRKTTPINLADINSYDVFVIPEANIPFKQSEQQTIADYVANGGAVFYVADHYNADRNKNRLDSGEIFNGYRRGAYEDITKGMSMDEKNSTAMTGVTSSDWLSETFGVRFRSNAIDNIENAGNMIIDHSLGILSNVRSVALHAGATLAITDSKVAHGLVYLPDGLSSANKWSSAVDQGVYNGGGIDEGPYIAISKRGAGKAAFLGDSSLIEDASPKYKNEETGGTKKTYDGYKEQDDATLLAQLMNWLGTDESYTNFEELGVPLSEETPLLDFETPENSTEPQQEPWAMPQVKYKWYDSSTFAGGSYGSMSMPKPTPQYTFSFDSTLYEKRENRAVITLDGLEPNTAIDALDFGIYTTIDQNGFNQGAQVAQTKIGNQPWKQTLGYSDKFSVTTDANGHATQEVFFKVGEKGTYNIRLRKNKNNVLTTSIHLEAENTLLYTFSTGNTSPVGMRKN